MAATGLKPIPYKTLSELLDHELGKDRGEEGKTAALIQRLRHIRKTKTVTRTEFMDMCHWKSPRPRKEQLKNAEKAVQKAIRDVLSTRSERQRLAYLTSLKGVDIPTASAILMLTNPKHYAVIDIRVWQLLFAIGSVSKRPTGKGFNFKNWYHYLRKLRYLAKQYGVSVRTIERTLFRYHKQMQRGTLYKTGSR